MNTRSIGTGKKMIRGLETIRSPSGNVENMDLIDVARKEEDTRKVVRITVDFPVPAYERFTAFSKKEGLSKVDVVRRALALYELLISEQHRGCRVIIEDGKERNRVFIT